MPRHTHQPGVSFFAFQDIITAVVGIFILITLIMVLELIEKVDAASRTPAGDAAAIERMIDQTKADADEIEQKLVQVRQRQERENQAIAISASVTEEQLQQQIEDQQNRNQRLAHQITAAQRQADDAESRFKAATLAAEAELQRLKSQEEQLQTTLADFTALTEKLQSDDSPLYNDTLADGRALVIIRLGDHPDSTARLSMREGDRRSNRPFVDIDSLVDAVKTRDRRSSHYMVLVAPGGAADFQQLRDFFDSTRALSSFGSRDSIHSIHYGFDVIGSDDDIKLVYEVDEW